MFAWLLACLVACLFACLLAWFGSYWFLLFFLLFSFLLLFPCLWLLLSSLLLRLLLSFMLLLVVMVVCQLRHNDWFVLFSMLLLIRLQKHTQMTIKPPSSIAPTTATVTMQQYHQGMRNPGMIVHPGVMYGRWNPEVFLSLCWCRCWQWCYCMVLL